MPLLAFRGLLWALRWLYRGSLHLGVPKLTDWLWHRKMDVFYKTVGQQSHYGW